MKKTLISVIIPVYNESATFSKLIEKIISLKIKGIKLQIIIVESNSSDGTKEQVELLDKKKFDIIFQKKAKGKGSAVIEGLKKVKGDIILIQDGDLEYDPNDYYSMISPLKIYLFLHHILLVIMHLNLIILLIFLIYP